MLFREIYISASFCVSIDAFRNTNKLQHNKQQQQTNKKPQKHKKQRQIENRTKQLRKRHNDMLEIPLVEK